MGEKKQRVPVTVRALIQRINRKLALQDESLRKARTENVRLTVGDYYIVDVMRNCIAHREVDIEEQGRQLGALKPWETVALEED